MLSGLKRFHESGNDYFGARYYANIEERFISPDWSSDPEPIPYGDLANPQNSKSCSATRIAVCAIESVANCKRPACRWQAVRSGRQSGHGFRAIASTILNESGRFKPDVIERQLAHCERNAVRGAYNRAEYLPERTRMMQAWAAFLEQTQRGGKVLPFRGSAA